MLVSPSFVPAKPLRELRSLTRYRRAQIEERTREVQRLDKVLQDVGLKLSSVATDILGRSGREMLAALVAGNRDPQALAELARGRLRSKFPALVEALESRFSVHHAALVAHILAKLDHADEMIAALIFSDAMPGIDRGIYTSYTVLGTALRVKGPSSVMAGTAWACRVVVQGEGSKCRRQTGGPRSAARGRPSAPRTGAQ